MKNKYTSLCVLGLIVITIIWISFYNSEVGSKKETLKVGVIAPLSGDFAAYGDLALLGVRAALGSSTDIILIPEDDACEPKKAISAYQKLNSINKVDILIGPFCGSPQEAVAPLVKNSRILTLLPSSAPKDVYGQSGGMMLQIQYSVEQESEFMAQTFMDKGYKKVALVSYENAFSQAHRKAFFNYLKSHDSNIELLDEKLSLGTTAITPTVLKIKSFNPDAVFINDVSFFFAGGVVKMDTYKITAPMYTTYAAAIPAVQPLVKGSYYSYPKNISEKEGPVFELSKLAAQLIVNSFNKCGNDKDCLQKEIIKQGGFVNGVRDQSLVINQAPK